VHADLNVEEQPYLTPFLCPLGSTIIKRVQATESMARNYVSAIFTEELPLHGLHYFEIRVKNKSGQEMNPRRVYVGLCNKRDNYTTMDPHHSKSSLLLNLQDSSFWAKGR